MVSIALLEQLGITAENLKGRFAAEPANRTGTPEEKKKVEALINRLVSRVDEGVSRNLLNWQWIYAIDQAWDTSFRNFHPRLVEAITCGGLDKPGVLDTISSLGLSSLVEESTGADNKPCKKLNYDKFVTLVQLCKSSTTMRWAKLVNDRRLIPYLKFDPAKMTTVNRAKCEVLTDRVQVMSTQYDYFGEMKQATLKMLQYSFAIQFIKEEWHTEEQVQIADDDDVKSGKLKLNDNGTVSTEKAKKGDKILVKVKEGLRYKLPHPSRVYRDLAYPLSSILTDTGIQFAGFWEIARYRDVLDCGFWNTDKILLGSTNIMDRSPLFFQTVYSACTLKIPTVETANAVSVASPGVVANDREKQVAQQYYGREWGDQGVMVTNHFEKLVPKDNGLGDYAHPVWFRFVLAGDGRTVLYAAPLPHIPMIYYGYDPDESRDKNPGMVQELLPFQYQFENMLSQIILSCKQNLANLSLVDEDVIDEKTKGKIEGLKDGVFRFINIFSYSAKKLVKLRGGDSRMPNVIQSYSLPKANIAEMVGVLNTILNVMERMIGASPQEVAQAASHELRAGEVRNMAISTSNRVQFTGTAIDLARDAQKRQLYAYLMAYGDDDFYGHIPADNEITKEQLNELGFEYVDDDKTAGKEKFRRVKAKKPSVALPLYEFAATRDGDDRQSDAQIATVLATFARDLFSNPVTLQAIGPDQAIELANKIAKYAGLPEVKLRNVGLNPEKQKAEAQEQLKGIVAQVLQASDEHMKQALIPLLDEVKKLGGAMGAVGAATEQNTRDLQAIAQIVLSQPPIMPNAPSQPITPPTPAI